jgi:3-dehydroquinate synthase
MAILSTIQRQIEGFCYHVILGTGVSSDLVDAIRAKTKSRRVFVLADPIYHETGLRDLLGILKLNGFEAHEQRVVAGKENKTVEAALGIIDRLIEHGFTRDATFVAIGGGVIGDLGGLAASLFYRGLKLVHIPTTLTAQVDSAIGAKVAVNYRNTINSIGTFYHPELVAIDLSLLQTLPEREFLAGMAEVIKVAFIADREFLKFLEDEREAILARKVEALHHVVTRSVQIKLDHVDGDVRDNSKRMLLNYGHTIGQAVEIATGLGREYYRHGEAVAIGMVGAAMLADALLESGDRATAHRRILNAHGLPTTVHPDKLNMKPKQLHNDVVACLFKDKKRNAGGHRFVLVPELGRAELRQVTSDATLNTVIYELLNPR